MYLKATLTTYAILGQVCVRYNKMPTSCLVFFTKGVDYASSSVNSERKSVFIGLNYFILNLFSTYNSYFSRDTLIPGSDRGISSPKNCLSIPKPVMEKP